MTTPFKEQVQVVLSSVGWAAVEVFASESGWLETYTARCASGAGHVTVEVYVCDGPLPPGPPAAAPTFEDQLASELGLGAATLAAGVRLVPARTVPFKNGLWVQVQGVGGTSGTYLVSLRGVLI
jgi:hypothetical protein